MFRLERSIKCAILGNNDERVRSTPVTPSRMVFAASRSQKRVDSYCTEFRRVEKKRATSQ